MTLHLINHTTDSLADYVCAQLGHFFPDGRATRPLVAQYLPAALARQHKLVNAVRWWAPDAFNALHSTQYCIFLYFLANTIWRESGETEVPTKLFGLNKTLNGIDLFYEIAMPDIFFIGHSVGIVLAKASYSDYLVLYQNSTVGKNHGTAPVIETGVVMFPNTAIIGRCHVGAHTIVAQGVGIVNQDTPGDCYAFAGEHGKLAFKPRSHDIIADIFRL